MKTSLIISCLLITGVQAVSAQHRLYSVRCQTNDIVFQLSSQRLRDLPNTRWRPESDLPAPVTLKQACFLAKASLKIRLPEWDDFEVNGVELLQIATPGKPKHWYYVITCDASRNRPLVSGERLQCGTTAVILMDGTSVDPIITRTPYNDKLH
jgi:hypothetical protein